MAGRVRSKSLYQMIADDGARLPCKLDMRDGRGLGWDGCVGIGATLMTAGELYYGGIIVRLLNNDKKTK